MKRETPLASHGVILNCLLMDRWKQAARAGDKEAIDRVCRAAPRDVPPGARLAYRDAHIRQLGTIIRVALATIDQRVARHRVAVLIQKAGHETEQGRSLKNVAEFDNFDADDVEQIEAIVRDALSWLPPPRRNGGRWPGVKQITGILPAD